MVTVSNPPLKRFYIEEAVDSFFLEGMFHAQEHDPDLMNLSLIV